jgi:predicted O-methyltransferase YrrM
MSEKRRIPSHSKLLREAKLVLIQGLFGQRNRNIIQKTLKETNDLLSFKPISNFESLMCIPSDIWQHLAILHMITIEYNLKTIVELGTAEGESTVALLTAARQIGGVVHSIDINPCVEAQKTIADSGLSDNWVFRQASDLEVNWNTEIDHLFIDTSHKYEHTLKELQKFEPHVRSGGVISMHDIVSFPEVMQAVTEYTKNRTDLRIYKFLHNNGLLLIFKK